MIKQKPDKKIQLFVIVVFLLIFSSILSAQQLKRHEVVAAYIYNFAKNVQWENEHEITEFQFRFIGEDQRIISVLNKIAGSETLRDKTIKVTSSESIADIENIHLLFVGAARQDMLRSIFNEIEGENILLISDGYEDKRFIMINFVDMPDQKLHFEINRANIINQNLKIMPEMVFLGGTEVDVAKLYKESQDEVRSREQIIADLEQNLADLNRQIEESSVEIIRQQTVIEDQDNEILRQRSQMDSEKKRQEDALSSQAKILEARDRQLSEQLEEIESRTATLEQQQGIIDRQDNEIQAQVIILEERGATIAAQKRYLYLLAMVIALTLIMIVTIFLAYKDRRKRAAELDEHVKEIEELNQEMTSLLEDLQAANIRLEEADRLKSVFLASMSHELRTPLNSIIGFTGIILMGMVGEVTEEQSRQLTIVKKNAAHLLELINDLLDISKIEAGRVELSLEEFKLNDVISEVIETVSPAVNEKGLELLTNVPEGIMLYSDERRIKQVIMNLVSNAVKFTEQGSVKITARVLEDEKLELSVIDTGIGIKQEDLSKLFAPFQQIEESLAKRYEGTGLGLYLCRKLTGLLGGEIRVKSEYDRGSEFTFVLALK
ncbi:Sensor histidine kinase RcsC [subsurface metagenome]